MGLWVSTVRYINLSTYIMIYLHHHTHPHITKIAALGSTPYVIQVIVYLHCVYLCALSSFCMREFLCSSAQLIHLVYYGQSIFPYTFIVCALLAEEKALQNDFIRPPTQHGCLGCNIFQ